MIRKILTLLCIGLAFCLPESTKAQVTANFTSNITTGCSPILVQFTDQSTGNPTSWYWDLGNGTTSTIQNPSTTYITPGMYTVTLTVSDGVTNNTKTLTNYISAVPTPAVSFIASDSGLICPPQGIQYTSQATPGIAGPATYFWDFGDGFTSNQANPFHTYSNVGNYSVTFSVTNSAGCSKLATKTNYIQSIPKSVAAFSATSTSACTPPFTVNFSNTSTGATTYTWDFGDGGTSTATSPSHTYTTSGSFNVRLITDNAAGCRDTLTMPAFVNVSAVAASFTKSTSTACLNSNVMFTNTSGPAGGTSFWKFGDGSTGSGAIANHSYANTGTYTVKLIYTLGGCIDSTTQTITVSSGPATQFSASQTTGCSVPFTTQFSNTSSGAVSYLWIFGDGNTSTATNPSHTYTSFGVYTVKLVSFGSGGCSDTLILTNLINVAQAQMSIGAGSGQSGCAQTSFNFVTYLNSSIPVSSYTWNFGDGTITSGGATMSHTYATPGYYVVSVNFTTGPGCNFQSSGTGLNVGTPPSSNFTFSPTTPCPLDTVVFTNTSTGGPGTTYNWYFGNGSTSTQTSPNYQYPASGVYTVMLIANQGGCKDTFQTQLTVSPPVAQFTRTYSCTNRKQVSFNNTSTGGTTYLWDFGDGNTSTLQNPPPHTYANFGTYNVVLTVTNQPSGCTSTHTLPVVLFDHDAQFTTSDSTLCKGQQVSFVAQSTPNTTEYIWNLGFGPNVVYTGSTANTLTHIYSSVGTYTIRLIVKDTRGCFDTLIKTNHVVVTTPTVNFIGAPLTGCSPLAVNFSDLSTSGASIVGRTWRFGDGTTDVTNAPTVSRSYNTGVYNVTLKVTDANGCSDSLTKLNYITSVKPVASFSTPDTNKCPGQPVTFINSSTGSGLTYHWFFGDGGTSTVPNPSHIYSAPGSYTVMLVVTNGTACKDTLVRNAYIQINTVNLGFTASDTFATCPPLTVSFTNTSLAAGNFTWSFGNGNTSSLTSPTTIFTLPGVYNVKLRGTNSAGCMDSVFKTIVVLGPNGTLSYSPINGCTPLTVQFTSTNTNTTQLIWDMSNGVTQTTTGSTTSYTYTTPGIYVPKLLLSDGVSCVVPIQGTDTIKADHIDADFSFPATNVCQEGTVQFTESILFAVNPVATRIWTFGDGGTSSLQNPSHFYASPGTYTVTLIIGTTQGCKDTIVKSITILPAPTLSISPNQSICVGQTSAVQLQATGTQTYNWSPAATLSCTSCGNPVASPTSTTTYTVIGTATNGCTDTAQTTVSLSPLPTIDAGLDVNICIGAFAQLQATGGVSYVWSPATGLSCTSCANPSASPTTTTTYTVTATDINGCTGTDNVEVAVSQLPTVSAGANQTICIGNSTQLQATGAANYSWSPAVGLSCTNCSNPVASPIVTTTYTVVGLGGAANNCSNSSQVTITVAPLPTVSAGGAQSFCDGGNVQLQATGAISYIWSPASGLSCTSCPNPLANPVTPTTYTVSGTDLNGCLNTSQVTITNNPLPTVSAGANQSICIGDSATLQATGAVSYSWSPASGLSCTTCANPSASPAATTTYTVTGTDASGCTNASQVTVTVNSLPTVAATASSQTICSGSTAQLLATGANTYSWSPATDLSCASCPNPTATPTATTTYTVVGTDANGCTNSGQLTLSVNSLPVVSGGTSQSICIGGFSLLQATGAVSYAWSPSAGLSCTSCANPTANPISTTTYTVTGTDINGCTNTSNVVITVNPLPPINAGPDENLCAGVSAPLQATGGVSYVWSPATGLSCTNCANPTATLTGSAVYTVTGTDINGCVNSDQLVITINPLPLVNAGTDQTICAGSSALLTATGAVAYSWSPSAGLSCTNCANPMANPASTTLYTVTGTDANGCTNASQVTITVNTLPGVSAGANQTFCAGDSVQLQATGAVTYSWAPATGLSCTTCPDPFAAPASTTTYTVTGTDINGCTNSAQTTITNNPLPVIITSADPTICAGSSVPLSVSGAATYSWSPAAGLSCTTCPNPIASPTTTTIYTITGTSSVGCTSSAMLTVNVVNNPTVVASAANNTLCAGDSTQLQPSGAASYSWSPAAGLSCITCANPMATPAVTTTYTVIGTAGTGCLDTAHVTITVNPLPVVSAGTNQSICLGSTAQLQATGAASYIWTPAVDLSCSSCPNPVAGISNTTTFTVTGTSINGCDNSSQVTITVNPLPIITASSDDTVCAGVAFPLLANGTQLYVWSPSTNLSCSSCPNPVATPTVTTTYMVVGTDINGCTDTTQVTLTVNPLPLVDAGPDQSSCKLDTVQLQASGAISYTWTPGTTLSCTTCDNPFASPLATTTYTVTGVDTNGCINTDAVVVNIHAQLKINAGEDKVLCSGQSVQLIATGGQSYVWSPATGLSCTICPDPLASPVANITYSVVGIDINGCQDSDRVVITVIDMMPFTVGPGDTLCSGESTQLFASGGDQYQWIPSSGLDNATNSNPIASPVTTTTYMVIIKQGTCFADTSEVTVIVNPIPTVNAGPDQTIIAGNGASLFADATHAAHYIWSPAADLSCSDCKDPVARPEKSTTYTVNVISEFGCESKDDVTVFVNCDNTQIFIANTFTPNADGRNDRFFPQGKGINSIKRFRILNRWGQVVYDVQNIPVNTELYGWDGTHNNEPLEPDVFIYILDATCATGEPMQVKGDISLIR